MRDRSRVQAVLAGYSRARGSHPRGIIRRSLAVPGGSPGSSELGSPSLSLPCEPDPTNRSIVGAASRQLRNRAVPQGFVCPPPLCRSPSNARIQTRRYPARSSSTPSRIARRRRLPAIQSCNGHCSRLARPSWQYGSIAIRVQSRPGFLPAVWSSVAGETWSTPSVPVGLARIALANARPVA